jgi:two-component system OmpR family sensor kinase
MRRITLEAQRMGGLVDDMLRLARLDQQPGQQCEPVDLGALATECVQRARTASPDWTWRCDVTGGLEVTGDEELLRRAIDNVLGNVAAHTPEGSTATLTAIGRDGQVILDVSDDGPGVPRSSCRASSTGSTGPACRPAGPAPAWDWPSWPPSPPRTAAR